MSSPMELAGDLPAPPARPLSHQRSHTPREDARPAQPHCLSSCSRIPFIPLSGSILKSQLAPPRKEWPAGRVALRRPPAARSPSPASTFFSSAQSVFRRVGLRPGLRPVRLPPCRLGSQQRRRRRGSLLFFRDCPHRARSKLAPASSTCRPWDGRVRDPCLQIRNASASSVVHFRCSLSSSGKSIASFHNALQG